MFNQDLTEDPYGDPLKPVLIGMYYGIIGPLLSFLLITGIDRVIIFLANRFSWRYTFDMLYAILVVVFCIVYIEIY